LTGDFAFALWDSRTRTVFAVRADWHLLSANVIDEWPHGNFASAQSIVFLSMRVERRPAVAAHLG